MPRRPDDKAEAARIAEWLGSRVRLRRSQLGFSQERVSELVGITPQAYGRIERGMSLPSYPTLLKLCRELGLRPDELLLEKSGASDSAPERTRVTELAARLDEAQLGVVEPLLRYLVGRSVR